MDTVETASVTAPMTASAERRRHERKRINVKVGLRSEHGFWAGFAEDISEGGLFVATRAPFDIGTELGLTLSLAGRLGQMTIASKVRSIRPDNDGGLPPGMGLEFLEIGAKAVAQIREYIKTDSLEVLFWED